MALAKTTEVVATVAGSVGGTTFRTGRSGLQISTRCNGRRSATAKTKATTGTFAASSGTWSRLSTATLSLWRIAAALWKLDPRQAWMLVSSWVTRTSGMSTWPVVTGLMTATDYSCCRSGKYTGYFFAVSQYPTASAGMYSFDGLHWTTAGACAVSNRRGVWFDPDSFVWAVIGRSSPYVAFSYDLITWTSSSPGEANNWFSICCGRFCATWVALSYSGTHRVATTTDRTTWTLRTAAAAQNWYCVWPDEKSGLFIACSTDGDNRIMTSPDGATWTLRALGTQFSAFGGCWSEELGLNVVVGSGSTYDCATSPDGITWTYRKISGTKVWFRVTWSACLGLFIATSQDSPSAVATSPDGITWTMQTLGATFRGLEAAVNELDGRVLIPGFNSTGSVAISPVTLTPLLPSGLPNTFPEELLTIDPPIPSSITWTRTTSGTTTTWTLTNTHDDYWYTRQRWISVDFGTPMRNGSHNYRGTWRNGGVVLWGDPSWTTQSVSYPYSIAITTGMHIPVRLRFLGRGCTMSHDSFTVLTT